MFSCVSRVKTLFTSVSRVKIKNSFFKVRMLLAVIRSSFYCKRSKLFNKLKLEDTTLKRIMSTEKLTDLLTPKGKATKYEKPAPPRLRREKQQQIAKKKNVPYVPGTVNLQVLGAGVNGSPAGIYMFTDQSRYLFNCGEGTQRLAHEHKTKLARLEQIFVTRNTWPMIGGIPGLTLTVQDSGVKELSLHGPPHLDNILYSMKRFVVLKNLQVKTIDATKDTEFEDAVMNVKSIPLYKTNSTESSTNVHDKVVIAYICKLKPRAGALNLDKCVAHGVPPGPLLGLLKNGIDVTLDDGTIVLSKDVSEPSEKGLAFVLLDIPNEDFLPALEAESAQFFESDMVEDENVVLIVHFSPAQMHQNNRYQNFMQRFPKTAQHLYLNSPNNQFSGYIASHRLQYHLNLLSPKVFPLLEESTEVGNAVCLSNKLKKTKLDEQASVLKEENAQTEGINSMTNYHLRPHKCLDRSMEAKLNPNEYIQETEILEDFPTLLQELKHNLKDINQQSDENSFPKITFLGTGSCIPNKTRNVSSILVQSANNSYILLDCGEGTLGQIIRFFGKTKAETVIRNLHAIYISHLHADHHIGLIGLLNERQRLRLNDKSPQKLLLFAPKQIEPWLNFYNTQIACIDDAYELIGNATMLANPLQLAEQHAELGLESIQTCFVRHCPHSFGVRLTLKEDTSTPDKSPISITYSGDSMPCEDLLILGKNTTILIHEATMEDDLIEEAGLKMHSTISQAIEQGREMKAEHIVLTHFSQRYAKLPRMQILGDTASEDEAMRNVSIAFDNMHISLHDLTYFHNFYPALRALFAEHAEELEQKALKRELKLERKRKLLSAD